MFFCFHLGKGELSAGNDLFFLLNANTSNSPTLLNFGCLSLVEGEMVPYGLSVPSLSTYPLFNTTLKAGCYRDIKAVQ